MDVEVGPEPDVHGAFRSKADTKREPTRNSAPFLTSSSRLDRGGAGEGRSFFRVGGLDLTAKLTVDRPGVKELAALSGGCEWHPQMDGQ
jgi:hypothetical protein